MSKSSPASTSIRLLLGMRLSFLRPFSKTACCADQQAGNTQNLLGGVSKQ